MDLDLDWIVIVIAIGIVVVIVCLDHPDSIDPRIRCVEDFFLASISLLLATLAKWFCLPHHRKQDILPYDC